MRRKLDLELQYKIIKHGERKYIVARDYRLECSNCGCIFEFGQAAITWTERKLDGNSAVRCPYCGAENIFKGSECLIEGE